VKTRTPNARQPEGIHVSEWPSAQDRLAVSVEIAREETFLHSETEIAALGQKARDLAVSVEVVREETLLQAQTEIAALGQKARALAVSVASAREATLLQSDTKIKGLKEQATNLAVSVETSRLETLMESDKVIRKLNADLEQRVLERTGQLEAANRELEAFSYSVSHDLRAPLRAIDGFSRILLEDHAASLADEGKTYLRMVRDNTRQMGQLVDDLLSFSRLGRMSLTKHTVEPDKLVRLCLAEMQKEQEGRRLEIVIGELPSCQADPTLLKQVWLNLLSNALKYTRKQDTARISIGCRKEPPPSSNGNGLHRSEPVTETVYFVKDNGAGFDMKYADKLFGVFQRLHRAADYDGTGVGLAIVQRIVNRHGGRVWGEAAVNQGATFSFTLE
jgi:signal transduction histidine kinase